MSQTKVLPERILGQMQGSVSSPGDVGAGVRVGIFRAGQGDPNLALLDSIPTY